MRFLWAKIKCLRRKVLLCSAEEKNVSWAQTCSVRRITSSLTICKEHSSCHSVRRSEGGSRSCLFTVSVVCTRLCFFRSALISTQQVLLNSVNAPALLSPQDHPLSAYDFILNFVIRKPNEVSSPMKTHWFELCFDISTMLVSFSVEMNLQINKHYLQRCPRGHAKEFFFFFFTIDRVVLYMLESLCHLVNNLKVCLCYSHKSKKASGRDEVSQREVQKKKEEESTRNSH